MQARFQLTSWWARISGNLTRVLVRKVPTGKPQNHKCSGDPNPQYFSKSTAVQMGGVLPYKWEAYCSPNGRRIAGFPFLRSLEARKVRRYKWGAYCRTNWRCTAVLFRQAVSRVWQKGSFQKSPPPRDSRGFRDSRDSREPPDCAKQRRIRPFLESLENLEILEFPLVKRLHSQRPLLPGPKKRLRFGALRGETLAFKEGIAII